MAFPGASDGLLTDPSAEGELGGSFVDVKEETGEAEKDRSGITATKAAEKRTKRKRLDGKKDAGEHAGETHKLAKEGAETTEDALKHARRGVEELLQSMLQSTRADGGERLEGKELQGLMLKSVEYGRVSCTFRVCENMLDGDEEFHSGGVSTLVNALEKLALSTVYSSFPKSAEQSIGVLESIPVGSHLHVVSMVVCSSRTALVTSEIRSAQTSRLMAHGRSMYLVGDLPQSSGRVVPPAQNVLMAGRANFNPTLAPSYKLVAPVTVQLPTYGTASPMNAAPVQPRPSSSGANVTAHTGEAENLPSIPVGVRRMSCCGHPRRHHPKHYCPNPGMRYPGYPKDRMARRRAL